MAVKVFISYADEDEKFLHELKKHLVQLLRSLSISSWYDRDMEAGSDTEKNIMEHLNSAQIVLLLLSPDFMSSDHCYNIEMKRALELNERKQVCIIPVKIRPVFMDKNTPFAGFPSLPPDGIPVSSSPDKDEAFVSIARGIQRVIEQEFPSVTDDKMDIGQSSGSGNAVLVVQSDPKKYVTFKHKMHGCDIRFVLSQSHDLQYTFDWEPIKLFSAQSRFVLWLDGKKIVDRKKDDLSYIDASFQVENMDGMILCIHKKKDIIVLIKVGKHVLYERKDTWDSEK